MESNQNENNQQNDDNVYRIVIDIEKLGMLDLKDLRESLKLTIDDPEFKDLTPHKHKRHTRFAAVLLGAYYKGWDDNEKKDVYKVFYEKEAKRQFKNLKKYLSPENTKNRVDFWCDFLDVLEKHLKNYLSKELDTMNVKHPIGKSHPRLQPPSGLYDKKGKIQVIDISKLNDLRDQDENPVKWMDYIDTVFKKDKPIYLKRHSMPEAVKQLQFNADIVTAYNENFNAEDILLPKIKARYNLEGKGITYESQQMYIRFLKDLEEQIRKIPNINPLTVDKIKNDEIYLLPAIKDPLEEKMEMMKDKLKEHNFQMGRTGNSETGEVTQEHHKTADIQIAVAKELMLKRRGKGGK